MFWGCSCSVGKCVWKSNPEEKQELDVDGKPGQIMPPPEHAYTITHMHRCTND